LIGWTGTGRREQASFSWQAPSCAVRWWLFTVYFTSTTKDSGARSLSSARTAV